MRLHIVIISVDANQFTRFSIHNEFFVCHLFSTVSLSLFFLLNAIGEFQFYTKDFPNTHSFTFTATQSNFNTDYNHIFFYCILSNSALYIVFSFRSFEHSYFLFRKVFVVIISICANENKIWWKTFSQFNAFLCTRYGSHI